MIFKSISYLIWTLKIAAGVEIIHSANILWKEKVQCPVKCYTNFFVQAGQLAQVNRPPQPPCEEAREIETENARDAHPATD